METFTKEQKEKTESCAVACDSIEKYILVD